MKGQGEVVRGQKKMTATARLPIAMKDVVRTGNGRIQITFQDNSVVKVTEQSRLIIDDFVYSPKTNGGKMGLRFASGTARFIGGKMNRPNINLKTPTATIGVRGTDFTATVDDIGKSMFILLPGEDGHIGEITVSTDAGIVVLNQAFQSTTVATSDAAPTRPVILNISLDLIDNMIIVSPPPTIGQTDTETDSKSTDDAMFELNQNFLQDDSLDSNGLALAEDDQLNQSFFDDVSVSAGKAIARIAPAVPSAPAPSPPATVVPVQTVGSAPAAATTASTTTTVIATTTETTSTPAEPVPEVPPEPPQLVIESVETSIVPPEESISAPPDTVDIADPVPPENDFPSDVPTDNTDNTDNGGSGSYDGTFKLEGTTLGFDLSTRLNTTVLGSTIRFYRDSRGIISIKTPVQSSINITITNDLKSFQVKLNDGTSSISILQKQ